MWVGDIFLSKNIVLDEEAFAKATADLEELGRNMDRLTADIREMLEILRAGFDTPAGRKFMNSCENNLLTPLEQQKLVIQHISENLAYAKQEYSSVFNSYKDLNNTIKALQA